MERERGPDPALLAYQSTASRPATPKGTPSDESRSTPSKARSAHRTEPREVRTMIVALSH